MAVTRKSVPLPGTTEQLALYADSVNGDWEPATLLDSQGREVLPALVGMYGYDAGTAKTVSVPSGARALSITCHSTTGGTVIIGGGAAIQVPANTGFSASPNGSLVGPSSIVFSATDACFVDWVQ